MQVHCISVREHIWVGGCGPRGVGELPAGGIRASQGAFSSCFCFYRCNTCRLLHVDFNCLIVIGTLHLCKPKMLFCAIVVEDIYIICL